MMAAILPDATGALAQASTPVWFLQEDLRLGSLDEGPYAFNEISHIVASPMTGETVVALFGEIRIFTAEGRYIRGFGREGKGPGEFSRLSAVGWSGDLLAAFKNPPGHVMLFTEAGELVEDRRVDVHSQFDGWAGRAGVPIAALKGGYYLWEGRGNASGSERPFGPLIRTDGEGDDLLLDRLAQEPYWHHGGITGVQRLTGPTLVAVDPMGSALVVVHQHAPAGEADAQFRVRKVDFAGKVEFARTYSFEPRSVPPAYRDSIIELGRSLIERWTNIPDAESTLRQHTRVPRFQPPVTEARLAAGGSIWLRREDLSVSTVTWLVLDRRGDLIGRLSLPAQLRILHIDGDLVWGVERDALDVQYAVRFRIRR